MCQIYRRRLPRFGRRNWGARIDGKRSAISDGSGEIAPSIIDWFLRRFSVLTVGSSPQVRSPQWGNYVVNECVNALRVTPFTHAHMCANIPPVGSEPVNLAHVSQILTQHTKCALGKKIPNFYALKNRPRGRAGPIFPISQVHGNGTMRNGKLERWKRRKFTKAKMGIMGNNEYHFTIPIFTSFPFFHLLPPFTSFSNFYYHG